MKKQFKLVEFPNVNDPRIYTFSYHLQNIQNTAQTLILNIIDKNKEVKVTIGIVVAILKRIQECVTSIQLLAIKGRSRDIAILLLNVMELRVDLQYIALNVDREDEWINHENEWRKPWEMSKQLKEIYEDKEDLEAERDMYHLFSMIKHGSPASKHKNLSSLIKNMEATRNISFDISITNKELQLDLSRAKNMIVPYLYGAGINISEACIASFKILARHRLTFRKIDKELKSQVQNLSKFLEIDLRDRIIQWNRVNNNEFRKKWDSVEREEAILFKKREAILMKIETLQRKLEALDSKHSFDKNTEVT